MQPWDILRPLTEAASTFDSVTRFIVFLLSAALFIISILAYRKTKSKRFLFVMLAFLFFAVKWGLKVADLFVSPGYFLADASENVFELIILASLFIAIFRK